mgnify:FL=1
MEIIYGTTNPNKIKEMSLLLKPFNIKLLSLKDINFNNEIEENGETFLENSLIKAKSISSFCKLNNLNYPILTDDAGISIKALNGRPGVKTARYAGSHAPQEIVLKKILQELTGVDDREATFTCSLTFILNDEIIQVEGKNLGTIAYDYKTLGGFTFSPIFIPDGYQEPMINLKNVETHRTKAVLKLIEELKKRKVI